MNRGLVAALLCLGSGLTGGAAAAKQSGCGSAGKSCPWSRAHAVRRRFWRMQLVNEGAPDSRIYANDGRRRFERR